MPERYINNLTGDFSICFSEHLTGHPTYLVFPIDLISAKRLPIIGWIDEAFSLYVAYQKVNKNITPEIEHKTDALLDKWFPEHTSYIEVLD